MLIQTEITPNPDALKFLLSLEVNSGEPVCFDKKSQQHNAITKQFFGIENVELVFFGSDFITITKSSVAHWDTLKPQIIMIIMDYLMTGLPFLNLGDASAPHRDLSETEQKIVDIIDTKVRPAVAMDGGDIVYKSFKDGVVYVELRGACSGCPSSTVTLKQGIESMLRHYVPEVESVESDN